MTEVNYPRTKGGWIGYNGFQIAQKLGLATNLKVALDAGAAASYTSGQSWLDLSGNGEDFFRGTTSGADATDPTFNGTAGRLSSAEYFSTDGGDVFTYDTTNPAWVNNIHKTGAKYTFICWLYSSAIGVARALTGTDQGNASLIGFDIFITAATNSLRFRSHDGSGTPALDFNPGAPCVILQNTWNFCAISIDETNGTSGALIVINGDSETASASYATPSASNATSTLQLMAEGNNVLPLSSGDRMAMALMWEGRALSLSEIMAFREATRIRFGV